MMADDRKAGGRQFSVSVTKDYLVFSSAHFITLKGHRCEALHGHNYRASVTVEGAIDPEVWYVFDFIALKDMMRELCDAIDHKVLLPLQNPLLSIGERDDSIAVSIEGRERYVFPRADCVLLPVPNTTVEMLAQLLAERLQSALDTAGAQGLHAIVMDVEENFGQTATCRIEWPAAR